MNGGPICLLCNTPEHQTGTWRGRFARHACAARAASSSGCAAEHNVPDLQHISAAVTFFSCWFLQPIRSGEPDPVGGACPRGRATLPLLSVKATPPRQTTEHGRASSTSLPSVRPLRVFLGFSSTRESPSLRQFMSDALGKQTTVTANSLPT